jgi:hypothetical protein
MTSTNATDNSFKNCTAEKILSSFFWLLPFQIFGMIPSIPMTNMIFSSINIFCIFLWTLLLYFNKSDRNKVNKGFVVFMLFVNTVYFIITLAGYIDTSPCTVPLTEDIRKITEDDPLVNIYLGTPLVGLLGSIITIACLVAFIVSWKTTEFPIFLNGFERYFLITMSIVFIMNIISFSITSPLYSL